MKLLPPSFYVPKEGVLGYGCIVRRVTLEPTKSGFSRFECTLWGPRFVLVTVEYFSALPAYEDLARHINAKPGSWYPVALRN